METDNENTRILPKEEELTVDAVNDNLDNVKSFIENYLNEAGVDSDKISKALLSTEEIFINICSYAYKEQKGSVTVSCALSENGDIFIIRIKDSGIQFNPLDSTDPTISDKPEDLQIGGLGIFITKQSMDDISYSYENGNNVLTMKKNI